VALPRIITLTTDFGINDGYVASIKGVILGINPDAKIVDICNTIKPQNILQASYIIDSTCSNFPQESIHIVVVDPGVGSSRKAIIVKMFSSYFIAPDNGVLSYTIARWFNKSSHIVKATKEIIGRKKLPAAMQAVSITNPRYWNKDISPVFHGRDIFAPVAAHLSLGVMMNNFGREIRYINLLSNLAAIEDNKGLIVGKVIHIDYFGNIITNIKTDSISKKQYTVSIGGRHISEINRYYAEKEGLLALIGSSGYLEVSMRNGNASSELGINLGDRVTLSIV
jgi:S-adenosylmethionine hydrolase